MRLADKLMLSGYPAPHPNSSVAKAMRTHGVSESAELSRILAIKRRKLIISDNEVLRDYGNGPQGVEDLTPHFRRPGSTLSLWPLQNVVLHEIYEANGGLFLGSVGAGKSLPSLLSASVLDSKRCVLLVKPQLRNKLLTQDLPFYNKHFDLPLDRIHVVSYNELSSAEKAGILNKLKPDLIVADECHCLALRNSARTRRFMRYFKENPGTRFVGLSGTISKRSILNYAHLLELALGKNSPLPNNFRVLEEWAEALDAGENPRPAGALQKLCETGEDVRSGYRRRLVETPGIVASVEGSIGTSLNITARKLHMPEKVRLELSKLYATWKIGEEELTDSMAMSRVARQIVSGFYYVWKWPEGKRDGEWIDARRGWHRSVREYLQHTSREGMDSPLLLARAAMSGKWACETWSPWDNVRDRPEPETLPIWISEFLVADAIKWGKEHQKTNGLIFYEHDAIGQMIAKFGNFPIYGAGADASTSDPDREPVIVCSSRAQGEGKNLQRWSNMLLTAVPANGLAFEQIMGRCHRPGQEADEVNVELYLHCDEFKRAFETAVNDAMFIEATQGQKQKLIFATKVLD